MYAQQQFDFDLHSINNNFPATDDFLSFDEAMEGWNQHQTFNQASESQCYYQELTSVAQVDSDAAGSDDLNSLFQTMDNLFYPTTADACVEKAGMEEEIEQTFLVADDTQEQSMSLDQIYQQLLLNSALAIPPTTTTTCFNEIETLSSDASSTSNSSSSSSCSKESKFDQSSFVEKKKRSKNTKQEKTIKKRASKAISDDLLWKHNKFSQSNSYLEINTNLPQVSITFEVYQTKRRRTPLASDKNDIKKICEISFQISNLDTLSTNYVSLKNRLDKEVIYGDEKVTKFYTWIRLKGTEEYLFFYCQTGKIPDVHNIVHYDNGKLATRANHLSKYSDKCSKDAQVKRSKTN